MENIERLIRRHLDDCHPGWTMDDLLAAAEAQRESAPEVASLSDTYRIARNDAHLNDILHRGHPAYTPWPR